MISDNRFSTPTTRRSSLKMSARSHLRGLSCVLYSCLFISTLSLHTILATEPLQQQITFDAIEEPLVPRFGPEVEITRQRRQFSFESANISLGYSSAPQYDHGPWGVWSSLSECTRVCDGGVQFQTRVCLNRVDPNACVGPSKRYFSCNAQNCPDSTDFRSQQCARFNSIPLDGKYYNWIPHTKTSKNPCQLNCRPKNERFYVPLARKVIDGTKCFQNETTDICIEGVCVELGCDRVLGSGLREDKCRVCGGDGSSCRTVEGVEMQNGFQSGYNDILLIPAGATNIVISEIKSTNNYFAVRSLSGKFYLNGNWHIRQSGTYEFVNTKFYYSNPRKSSKNKTESLRALGPTSEPLLIVLLSQEPNQGIAYQYSVPLTVYQPLPSGSASQATSQEAQGSKYAWIFGDFASCSKKCGTGVQRRNVFCGLIEHETGKQEQVKDDLCDLTNRPVDSRTCVNEHPCPATWFIGEWSNCSCVHQKQHRNVFCTTGQPDENNQFDADCPAVAEEKCHEAGAKPLTMQNCAIDNCPEWITSQWTKCDSNCGKGNHKRTVGCGFPGTVRKSKSFVHETQEVIAESSDIESVLIQKREVETSTITVDAVEATTLSGVIEESIQDDVYVDDSMCDPEKKPEDSGVCFNAPCDETGSVEWATSAWSKCDQDCGSQVSTRLVSCVDSKGQIWPDAICLMMHGGVKPADNQNCGDRFTCSKSFWFTSEWSSCSAKLGAGVKTRHVLCAHFDEESSKMVLDEDEAKCSSDSKPQTVAVCESTQTDSSTLFSGPFGPCTKPCGGGNRKRSTFCMKQNDGVLQVVDIEQCKDDEPDAVLSQQCNANVCDADQEAQIVGCQDTPFGCCPTDASSVADEDFRNCPNVALEDVSCKESEFGCCPGSTVLVALGPFGLGCPVSCFNTQFGCCSDGETIAQIADKSDCPKPIEEVTTTTMAPTTTETVLKENLVGSESVSVTTQRPAVGDCSSSEFGCCPDDWTSATGPNGEGCEDGSGDEGPSDSFFTTTMSSIVNLFSTSSSTDLSTETGTESSTSTEEPQVSGTEATTLNETVVSDSDDCSQTEFGCCPNGKTKATGPRYYGCTCLDYPFGCCQDRYTPASGENLEGCICSRMLYGCCADGKTPMTGSNNEGCTCDVSPHGCCPDLVSPAHGPNYHGCPCDTLTYGCCPGSKIPAQGPDFKGCSCADTPFGCCPDGVTVAYGPNFKGCPSGPSLNLKLNSEVCGLQMEVGSCRNFTVKWYFDVNYGSCSRFWYGGCEGNGNRFPSQELCEGACVKPEGTERCTLPMVRGPCNETQVAWHFSTQNRRCEPFNYGGCLGNTNRFESRRQCEEHCVYQEKAGDICEQPMSQGECQGQNERWFYRREDTKCHRFLYGGCKGNDNNFLSEQECQNACAAQSPHEICALPRAEGRCLGNFPRWSFDSQSGVCREFVYTGCEGNKNRFVDRDSCERTCNQTVGLIQNQITSEVAQSVPKPTSLQVGSWESVCALPKAEGPCRASIIQWFYNSTNQRCERFYFGGCEGNANRFDDRQSCEHRCLRTTPQDSDPCLEPKETGNCSNYSKRWYFDVEDRGCHRFYYSGCGGNRNNFASPEDCVSRCERPRKNTPSEVAQTVPENQFRPDFCFKDFDSGPCHRGNHIRLYYDRRDGVCKEFIYGGCGGNENRFESQYECQTRCWNSQDLCKLKPVRGTCSANFTQWFFDYNSNECFEFQFSGCNGNANRFSSKSSCDQQCRRGGNRTPLRVASPETDQSRVVTDLEPVSTSFYHVPEHCRLPKDPGPCRGYFQKWYYSTQENQCQMFIYGGCNGNINRFNNLSDCENACHPRDETDAILTETDDPQVVCRLPAEEGPCEQSQAMWYYEPSNHTCVPFAYGGCRGNKNRFQNYERCIGFCNGIMTQEQEQPIAPQPQVPSPVPETVTPKLETVQPYPPVSSGPLPTGCEPVDCQQDRCSLGIDYFQDSRGCPACRCTNPCNDYVCPQDMTCALELYLDFNGKPQGRTECRLNVKPGECPAPESILSPEEPRDESKCIQQCRTDAHCRGNDKCCNNGCTFVCVSGSNVTVSGGSPAPSQPVDVDHRGGESHPQTPTVDSNENEVDHRIEFDRSVTQSAGQDALIDCVGKSGNADVVWTRNGQQISESMNTRYEVLANGSLRIKNIDLNDDAVYVCYENQSPLGRGTHLQIEAPARIVPNSSDKVNGRIGELVYLHCNALGHPTPRVTWSKDDKALLMDTPKYYQFPNNTLLIQSLDSKDSGIYSCQASNGIGSTASWEVYLLLDSTTGSNEQNVVEYDASVVRGSAPSASTHLGSLDRIAVEIQLNPAEYKVGSDLELKCIVRSQITGDIINPTLLSQISWFVNSEIPLADEPTQSKHRLRENNSTLLVQQLSKTDSGEYRCRANTGPHADASSSVRIQVEDVFVPAKCQDSPKFAHCNMIAKGQFCNNPFYYNFCCRTCYIAEQNRSLR